MPPGRFCVFMGLLRVMLARSHSPVPLPAAFVSVTRQPTTGTEVNMAIINMRDYYPFYTSDCFMEVSEEVAEMFKEFDRKEAPGIMPYEENTSIRLIHYKENYNV